MLSGDNFEYSPFFYGRPKMKIIKNNVNNTKNLLFMIKTHLLKCLKKIEKL